MYHSKCYNYDFLCSWLNGNLITDGVNKHLIPANSLALSFSRLYFDVADEDIIHAMEDIKIPFQLINGERHYAVVYSEKAQKKLNLIWN